MSIRVISLAFVMIFGFMMAKAQQYPVMKRAKWISGTGSFSNTENPNSNDRLINISFGINYNEFARDNFFVGGGLNYSHARSGSSRQSQMEFGVQLGYAFGDENFPVYPFIDAGGRYGYTKNKGQAFSVSSDQYYYLFGTGGMIVPFSDHLGMVLEAGYREQFWLDADGNKPNLNNATIAVGFIGLLY